MYNNRRKTKQGFTRSPTGRAGISLGHVPGATCADESGVAPAWPGSSAALLLPDHLRVTRLRGPAWHIRVLPLDVADHLPRNVSAPNTCREQLADWTRTRCPIL